MRNRIGKNCIALFAFVGSIFSASISLAQNSAAPKPIVKFEENTYNFGSVNQGAKITHEFIVTNLGNADLHIQRLVPACGCTAASVDGEMIAPGAKGKIRVEFDTNGLSGEKLKTVRVYTNDIDENSSMLSLKGTVVAEISVEPQTVFFGDYVKGAKEPLLAQEVIVEARSGTNVKIGEIKAFSKSLIINEIESTPKRKKISVALSPDINLGDFRERIIVNLSGGSSSTINVPVFASVKGYLRLKPAQISFGVIEGQQEFKRSVKLENLGPAPIQIKSIKSTNPAISTEVKAIKNGEIYVIEVKLNPGLVDKDLRATLDIITDSKEQEQLTLNVYGILPPKI